MHTAHMLYEVLYTSVLSPATPLSAVADIARHARLANAASAITGLLVFDGGRFCQQLEGTKKHTMALIERIRADDRHTQVEILHHGPIDSRRFRGFRMGYSVIDDVEHLLALEQLHGEAAVQAFMALATQLELSQ